MNAEHSTEEVLCFANEKQYLYEYLTEQLYPIIYMSFYIKHDSLVQVIHATCKHITPVGY